MLVPLSPFPRSNGSPCFDVSPAPTSQALSQRLMHSDILETMTPQNIANTVWAFATLGITDVDVLKALASPLHIPMGDPGRRIHRAPVHVHIQKG